MNEFNMEVLATNLRIERAKKRMTQEQVAKAIGASQAAVQKWESGESVPLIEAVALLAQLYGTTVDDLIGFKSVKHSA